MRRLSSDWESTRLKIELSPVQIREAAYSYGSLCINRTAVDFGSVTPAIPERFEPAHERTLRWQAFHSIVCTVDQHSLSELLESGTELEAERLVNEA